LLVGIARESAEARKGAKMSDQFILDENQQTAEPVVDRESLNLLTTEKALAGSKIEQTGWVFDLTATLDGEGKPQQALVRRVSIADTKMINALPQHVQQALTQLLDEQAYEASKAENKRGHKGNRKKLSTKELVTNLEDGMEIANIMCIAGFIEPRVYWSEEEAEQNGGVWVEYIHTADRLAFNRICQADAEAIAERLRPFLGGPIVDVPSVEAGAELSEQVSESERSYPTPSEGPRLVGSYTGPS